MPTIQRGKCIPFSILLLFIFTACSTPVVPALAPTLEATGGVAATQTPEATATMAATPTPEPAQPAEPTAQPIRRFAIGISNSVVSNDYRVQMIQDLQEVNAAYMKQGITSDLLVESTDTDSAGQVQQIQTLIHKKVDAILVYPGDVDGLTAIVQEAVANGILVISVDQEIPVEGVYSVGIDQKEWAKISARWMAEKLGGSGNIVEIEGTPDHPANLARMSGVDEVLKDYPGIKVLGRGTGKWNEATAQQVMSNFLLSFPYLDGYWTQESMASGALQAVMAVRKNRFPALVGEGSCQFLNLWSQMLQAHPDFETIAVVDPPGVSSSGLRIAVQLLQGKKPDEAQLAGQYRRTFNLPVPLVVNKGNFAQVFETCKDKPENYLLDGILTEEEVQQFFVK